MTNRDCKLANEMTQDLCTSGDKGNFIQVGIGMRFLSFSRRFYEVDVMGTSVNLISIESTCIDNKLGSSLNIFDFIVCEDADHQFM